MPIIPKLSRGFTGRGPRVDTIVLGADTTPEIDLDPLRQHIFIWVPGTSQQGVNAAFQTAVDDLLDGSAQVLHVQYPAAWNFTISVPMGTEALKRLLRQVHAAKAENQTVYLAGFSQGAWVISNVIADPELRALARKTILYGHPGVAPNHYHEDNDDDVWEVNNSSDAVTFGWDGREQEIIDSIGMFFGGKPIRGLLSLIGNIIHYPKTTLLIIELLMFKLPIFRDKSMSPHDYSKQMPFGIYWLTH